MGNKNSTRKTSKFSKIKPKINQNKYNPKTHLPSECIKRLNKIKINSSSINHVIRKVKSRGNISKPLIIIVSPDPVANSIRSAIPNQSNVTLVAYTTHKDIQTGIADQIKYKFCGNTYDALVIKLMCIVSRSGEKQQLQFYYDLHQEARHIDKLRNAIKFRLPSNTPIIIESGSCPVFHPTIKNSVSRKFRRINSETQLKHVVSRDLINQVSKHVVSTLIEPVNVKHICIKDNTNNN
eukprot:501704_1